MQVFTGAAFQPIVTAQAFVSGAWRTLTVGKAYKGGAWQSIVSFVLPLSLSISPNPSNKGGTGYVTSKVMTATPSGGLAPFTYLWALMSASGVTTLNSTTTASTTVTANVSSSDISFTLQCTATDSLGTTATATVSGVLFDNSLGPRYL